MGLDGNENVIKFEPYLPVIALDNIVSLIGGHP